MRIRLLTLLGVLALSGCGGSTGPDRPDGTPPYQSFTYPAATVVLAGYQAPAAAQPGATAIGVRLTNTGSTPATIEHGACSVAVWLYRDDLPDAPPVWQNRPDNVICIDVAYLETLAPGASYNVAGATLGVLQPTLPTGRYLARVAIKRGEAGAPMTAELIVLDAGTIVLVR